MLMTKYMSGGFVRCLMLRLFITSKLNPSPILLFSILLLRTLGCGRCRPRSCCSSSGSNRRGCATAFCRAVRGICGGLALLLAEKTLWSESHDVEMLALLDIGWIRCIDISITTLETLETLGARRRMDISLDLLGELRTNNNNSE